jgi:phosphatidylinositol glycan class O
MVKSVLILLWAFLIHCAGIYLFTSGFLLSRLSLPNFSTCDESCSAHATHSRAVILIIDALRFDFVAPNPPLPPSPFHHNVLTLPQQLTAENPRRSFLFDTYVDPPTTTLQRIKGLTTGSLPTFLDLGSNFGAASIEEDSLIQQLKFQGKKLAFMGDDTWMSVFPASFHPNMTFPEDSFNVEDLHSVDNGVIKHMFPLLQDPERPFDVLFGHFLGVDHVGHRMGPDHPAMHSKLKQMNDVLTRVVELLDDDTLLVVLGDHGMDRSGDHGGDGELETHAATWIYSKGKDLMDTSQDIPTPLLAFSTFPGATTTHRLIQQIDLVPTISVLLGASIPFNNLGSVIPETFWRSDGRVLQDVMQLNVNQIRRFLEQYRQSSAGGELEDAWPALTSAAQSLSNSLVEVDDWLLQAQNYHRFALETCRFLWAQFNPGIMSLGLGLLFVGMLTSVVLYLSLQAHGRSWNTWVDTHLPWSLRGAAVGSITGMAIHTAVKSFIPGMDTLDWIVFCAPLFSCIGMLYSTFSTRNFSLFKLPSPYLIIHTISFFSNSFTFWEERVVPFLAVSSLIPAFYVGFTALTSRIRYRILGFGLLFAICVRLIATSTVCREEQQPYCQVTFYSSASLPSPPIISLLLSLPASLALPIILQRFLSISKSEGGIGNLHRPWLLSPSLLVGTFIWIMEWAETTEVLGAEWAPSLRFARTAASWTVVAFVVLGLVLYWKHPLCLEVDVISGSEGRSIQLVGHANAFGSPYILFWSIFFSLVFFTTQLTGQIVLSLSMLALLAYLELTDSVRDSKRLEVALAKTIEPVASPAENPFSPLVFTEIVPVALLGMVTFYGTGHQSTISSIQWKTSFLLTSTAHYQLSPITVLLNSFGPFLLLGLAVPLVGVWNRPPLPIRDKKHSQPDKEIRAQSILAGLAIMIYYSCLLLGASTSAAFLRRHLMVWKVFAPRFMTAVSALIFVDLGVILGVGVGIDRTGTFVGNLLQALHISSRPKTL